MDTCYMIARTLVGVYFTNSNGPPCHALYKPPRTDGSTVNAIVTRDLAPDNGCDGATRLLIPGLEVFSGLAIETHRIETLRVRLGG